MPSALKTVRTANLVHYLLVAIRWSHNIQSVWFTTCKNHKMTNTAETREYYLLVIAREMTKGLGSKIEEISIQLHQCVAVNF
jgi:hypothetical protein